jgi:hypothetical protein
MDPVGIGDCSSIPSGYCHLWSPGPLPCTQFHTRPHAQETVGSHHCIHFLILGYELCEGKGNFFLLIFHS